MKTPASPAPFPTIVLAAALALGLASAPRPARAAGEHEACISSSGYSFDLSLCDTVPVCGAHPDAACAARSRRHYERQARVLARAAAMASIMASDSAVKKAVFDKILHLEVTPQDSVVQLLAPRYWKHKPEFVRRFAELRPELPVTLHTVVLGITPSQAAAEARAKELRALCAGWRTAGADSSWPTWKVTEVPGMCCWHADLFVLPPEKPGKPYQVLHGIYLNEANAKKAAARLRPRISGICREGLLKVDGRVMQAAREWADRQPFVE